MKYVRPAALAATAIALGSSPALAGGMAEPIEMAPVEIVEDTGGGTSANLIVPLILIALIAAAVSASDSGGGGNGMTEMME